MIVDAMYTGATAAGQRRQSTKQCQPKAETVALPNLKEFQTTAAVMGTTVDILSDQKMSMASMHPANIAAGVVFTVCQYQQQQQKQQQKLRRHSVGVFNIEQFSSNSIADTVRPQFQITSTAPKKTQYQNNEKCSKENRASCRSPPFFIVFISLLEIGVFVYDYLTVKPELSELGISVRTDSVLIYRPDRRLEFWRFISYMLLHANWFHLSINVALQLLYGLPLEFVHGSFRIFGIYLGGVLAGSLGTSVVDSTAYLVGASGGVYALLAAQLAHLVLNFDDIRSGAAQLISVCVFVACDLGYLVYCKKFIINAENTFASISYTAHMTGALAGLTLGLLLLKNFDNKTRTRLIWWLSLCIYATFNIFAVAFNLINTMTAQRFAEEEGDVIKKHLPFA